ncbi:TonB family protein [Brevundimonas sp.]|jgi:protein TonB|uniref:TonB family protein n=1 Tax=Brevundimonas sp. TaxID=1871086 RepID=UPI0025BA3F34|nr:TonB family protein [Brevundimonas sp.]
MTDVEYHRSRYDPPRKKGFLGVPPGVLLVSVLFVLALFGLLAIYLINMQFTLREVRYTDDTVDVELIEPIPEPPPPPPPPPPPTDTPPPPKLQVRVPAIVPNVTPVEPVRIEPVKKEDRIENTAPPVITPDPPRPAPVPAPARPSLITQPSWARQVPPEFPERASARGIESGRVTLQCTVQPNGSLSNCSVVSEDPAGAGFGQAALAAARRSRVSPRTVDGAAEGATVRWTTRFVPPTD